MKDERPIPEEIRNLWLDADAAEDLRDTYAKRPFGFKKALRAARLAQDKRREFWVSLRNLYPDWKQIDIHAPNDEGWTASEHKGNGQK